MVMFLPPHKILRMMDRVVSRKTSRNEKIFDLGGKGNITVTIRWNNNSTVFFANQEYGWTDEWGVAGLVSCHTPLHISQ